MDNPIQPKSTKGFWKGVKVGLPFSFFLWLVIGSLTWYFRTH